MYKKKKALSRNYIKITLAKTKDYEKKKCYNLTEYCMKQNVQVKRV